MTRFRSGITNKQIQPSGIQAPHTRGFLTLSYGWCDPTWHIQLSTGPMSLCICPKRTPRALFRCCGWRGSLSPPHLSDMAGDCTMYQIHDSIVEKASKKHDGTPAEYQLPTSPALSNRMAALLSLVLTCALLFAKFVLAHPTERQSAPSRYIFLLYVLRRVPNTDKLTECERRLLHSDRLQHVCRPSAVDIKPTRQPWLSRE